MRNEFITPWPNVIFITDPENALPPQVTPKDVMQMCGLIPSFINGSHEAPMYKQAVENYEYYMGDFEGFAVNPETMVMSYPGDLDQTPIMIMERYVGEDESRYVEKLAIYRYGWVTGIYRENGEEITRTCRMD